MKEDVGVFKVVMWKEQICKAKVEIQVNCELGYMLQSWAPASLEAAVKTAWMSSEISENSMGMGYSQLPKDNKNYTSGSRMLECVTAALFQKPPTAHMQRSKGTKLRRHLATYWTSYGTNLAADYVHWIVYSWHSSRNLQQNTEPNRGGSRLKTLGTKCQSTTPRLITQAPRWQIQYNTEEHRTVVPFGTDKGSGGLCMTLIRGAVKTLIRR